MNTNTFGDEPSGDLPLTRIADALEIHNTLYLAYLNMAFGAGMVEMTLEELAEGEYE
jgi:hypothetical protein